MESVQELPPTSIPPSIRSQSSLGCLRVWLHEAVGGAGRTLLNIERARRASLFTEATVVLAFVLLVWTSIGLVLIRERNSELSAAINSTGSLARAFEESTRRTLSEIDQSLLSARAFFVEEGAAFRVSEWAKTQHRSDGMTAQIGLVDAQGYVFDSTMKIPERLYVGDRSHFLAQRDSTQDDLYISDPVVGRSTGHQTIQFSRKLFDVQGSFAGIIVLSLDCDRLSSFYQSLSTTTSFVALVSRRGTLLARGPMLAGRIGQSLTDRPLFIALSQSPAGWLRYRSLEGFDRLTSFRQLQNYPVAVAVGLDVRSALEHYRNMRLALYAGGTALTLIILLAGAAWIRQRRRSAAASLALSATLANINQGIVMLDERGAVRVANARAAALLGLPPVSQSDSSAIKTAIASAGLLSPTPGPASAQGTDWIVSDFDSNDGSIIEVQRRYLAPGKTLMTFADVTEQREWTAKINFIAHHDSVTGLPNRLLLRDHLDEIIARGDSRSGIAALLLIDLDGFKTINDTLGHEAGDLLLVEVARRLKTLSDEQETMVARMGGDEFVIVLSELSDTSIAASLAQAIAGQLARPHILRGREIRVGASIGVAFYPRDGDNSGALLKAADLALYTAKEAGRGTYRLFSPSMIEALQKEQMLETDLRSAIENGDIEVYFQPEFDTRGQHITGFEALARWCHPTHGAVAPSVFIPLAEKCGLIGDLGRLVLNKACCEAASWRPGHKVAVNISPAQFRDGRVQADIAEALAESRLPPHLLEIEVTEGLLIDDEQTMLEILADLREIGISIALDDFGTGYSSLSYIQRFPLDRIKIDRSFVQRQENDPGARAVVEATLFIASRLNLGIIAEGVETQQQLDMLVSQGCREAQGFLLGRPMTAWNARELISSYIAAEAPALTDSI